jgi:serine/threonine protein phosphatase PrpC/CRP-like cAMP-binding protein
MTNKKAAPQRIDSISETCVTTFGGVSVRYAYLSQRGYYPDDAYKANQDSYSVTHNFSGRKSDAFFGVYDGHGRDGDKCSQFARDHLPPMTAKIVDKVMMDRENAASNDANNDGDDNATVDLSKDVLQNAITKAHVECNKKMHACQDLDDSLSGTTSISLYLHGNTNKITVSNVGDSRAVIGRSTASADKEGSSSTTSSSTLKAFALSRDQTPYRRDERIRCKKQGARVLSLDQIEGLEPINEDEDEGDEDGGMELGEEIDEGGDPPRIWSPHGDYPGTAFTRSLGDAIAEELGVYAEPEMLSRELTKEDKIIVLASDGVFEFLTNQSVIDICAKFSDPLEACRAVVAESYELWLQYEMRTDDITMICIFVDDVGTPKSSSKDLEVAASMSSAGEQDDALISNTARPVRSSMSTEKSRAIEMAKKKMGLRSVRDVTQFEEEDFDLESLYTEKTDEEKASISEAIRASVMFQNITDDQRELIYKVMEPMPVKEGQWVIKQGTVGDRFYIVDEGRFEVRIVPENQKDEDGTGGNCVHVYEGSRENHSHPSFGELALMYSAPRAASIISQTDGLLWALHRYAFKKVIAEQTSRKDAEKVLKKLDMFKSFSSDSLKELASSMSESKFSRGDVIINEGDVGESMYIILPPGSCKKQTSEHELALEEGAFFGEEVLKAGAENKYLSTVTASSKLSCLTLQKSDAKRVISSMRKGSTNMA